MTNEEKIDVFKTHLSRLFRVPVEEITDDKNLITDLYVTSMHYYGMISKIKQLSGKEVDYPTIKSCQTVGDTIALLLAE